MIDALPAVESSAPYYYQLISNLNNNLSLEEVKRFRDYILSDNVTNPIDRVMKKNNIDNENFVNDVIGTRLIREGNFREALPYLADIDLKWIGKQPVSPYFRHHPTNAEYYKFRRSDTSATSSNINYNYNYKANFCAEILNLIDDYSNSSGDEKAKNALDIAAMCHFASVVGDGWALTDYSWSGAGPESDALTDMMKVWANRAREAAVSDNLKSMAYYALLSVSDSKQKSDYGDYYYYNYPFGFTSKGYTPNGNPIVDRYYLNSPSTIQKQGLQFIASHWNDNNLPYYIKSCDVLKSYVAGNFISKPIY